jgi:hypothetical protein
MVQILQSKESQYNIVRELQHTEVRKIPRRQTYGRARRREGNTTDNTENSLSDKVIGQDRIDDRQFDPAIHLLIDQILIDRRQHSSVLDIRSFWGADYDINYHLVLASLARDWQLLNKQRTNFKWRGSISKNKMRWRVRISIGLKSEIGSQLWEA